MNVIIGFIEEFIEEISDIHLKDGEFIFYRRNMDMEHTEEVVTLTDIEDFLIKIKKIKLIEDVYKKYNVDFSCKICGYRFRGNIFLDRMRLAISLRKINNNIKYVEELNLPKKVLDFCKTNSGIIFITGPTGSGKSTTMASIIEYINLNMKKHIITIEDPIEQEFESKQSLINQREIGIDVDSFINAIKSALRQDPDIIVIGEVRDVNTMKVAISAAETGHLCICTLHTLGAVNSIERIIGMFSKEDQDAIRYELSLSLKGILSQQLLKSKSEKIIPVVELMISDKSISNMIKENKINQISNYIMTNYSKGLISMDKSLIKLYENKIISKDVLLEKSIDKDFVSKKF